MSSGLPPAIDPSLPSRTCAITLAFRGHDQFLDEKADGRAAGIFHPALLDIEVAEFFSQMR